MKVALVSIIRNERKDILPWLAWHAKLGFDSFILFDDHSDDGTEFLLKVSLRHLDVRLFRIENVATSFSERQRIVYLDVLSRMKNSFDWVIFLDPDEYLNLDRHHHIHDFLTLYKEPINAIAIHRCTYGTSQEILHPDYPDFHSFTRHGAPDHPLNRWVKSFIRPVFFNKEWVNCHYLPPAEGRYVTVEDKDIEWEQPGQTLTPAQWQTASILHYPGGCLEDIVSSALRGHGPTTPLKDIYTKELTCLQDSRPQGKTVSLLQWIRPLVMETAILALQKLEALFPPDKEKTSNTTERQNIQTDFQVARLIAWNKQKMEVQAGFAYTPEHLHGQSGIFLFYDRNAIPGPAMIFALDHQNNPLDFFIRSDSRLSGFLPYHCLPAPEPGHIRLQKQGGLSQKRTFLASVPREALIADRPVPYTWESFGTEFCEKTPNKQKWTDLLFFRLLMSFLSGPKSIKTILALSHQDHTLTIRLLPFFMEYLKPEEKRILKAQLHAVQPYLF